MIVIVAVKSFFTRIRDALKRRTSDTGRVGEDLAARHLEASGYRILARNLRLGHGEIDLIAEPPDARVFAVVEVKCSEQLHAGFAPELRVNRRKQRKLATLAAALLQRRRLTGRPIRFDVVAVTLRGGDAPLIRHFPGAFDSPV